MGINEVTMLRCRVFEGLYGRVLFGFISRSMAFRFCFTWARNMLYSHRRVRMIPYSASTTSYTCLPVYSCIPTDDTTLIIIGQRIRPFDRTAFRSPHKRHPCFGMPIVRPQRGAVPTLALWSRLGLAPEQGGRMDDVVRLRRVCCWLVFVNRSRTTCISVSRLLTGASVSRDAV
jgi:hypothetical protein